jgi:GST-like protein
MSTMVLYGVPGWGSVLVEAMLAWCGAPHDYADVDGFDRPGPARDRLCAVNALAQVPTLVLPDGRILTESAAIALWSGTRRDRAGGPCAAPSPDGLGAELPGRLNTAHRRLRTGCAP